MSYQYSSYKKTTTNDGYSQTTTTTTTSSGTGSSLIVRELTETEVSSLPLSTSSKYEISDEDRLTNYDFYSLMDSEDEENSETDSESDVEYHWFPSLLKKSVIEFLDDNDDFMDEDNTGNNVFVIENDDSMDEEEEDEDTFDRIKRGGKRFNKHHSKKHSKKPKKSDIVPVEVVHVVL